MKRIAVLSSGSDNSGINGAIRAVVRTAQGKGIRVFGVKWGFRGLYEDHISVLTSRDVSGKIGKAGCFLGTSRPGDSLADSKLQRIHYNLGQKSIDGLIVIGGAGSLAMSQKLIDRSIPVVGIPSTIQDDIEGTDIALGVDSAINNIMKAVDHIRSCDSSMNRSFLVQVDGTNCGNLALRSAIVCGSEICLIPEYPTKNMDKIVEVMSQANKNGKTQCIAMISDGWKPGFHALSDYLEKNSNENDIIIRKTVLGYIQRGGSPTGYDRILGTKFGYAAVNALIDGYSGHIVALKGNKIENVPYSEFVGKTKKVDEKLINLYKVTNSL